MTSTPKQCDFTRFLQPILEVLREIGGSGTAAEVTDTVIERLGITEAEQQAVLERGRSRVRNQVHWARLYLAKGGFLDASKRGVWVLTEKGQSADLSKIDPKRWRAAILKEWPEAKKLPGKTEKDVSEISGDGGPAEENYRSRLLDVIKSLPPSGFERLCQRLLRESGFQHVEVTGKTNDGGIDGIGILKVNAFVSFNVLFQCKRYQGAVTPSQVRDFRGAMMGRADKGLILTTGSFTVEATKEARRDGVPPIKLVGGEDLVLLFEEFELGLKPRQTYDIDDTFFDEFRK
jgi:restriction system protein